MATKKRPTGLVKNKTEFEMAEGLAMFSVDPRRLEHVTLRTKVGVVRIAWADLWGMVFSLANDREREDIIPTRQREMMQFERAHTIKITKDTKAGETVRVICNVDVPLTVIESLKHDWTAQVRVALGKWLEKKGIEVKADDFLEESTKEVMHSIATNTAEKGVELNG